MGKLLAILVLCFPSVEPLVSWQHYHEPLQELLIEIEILDPAEVSYVLTQAGNRKFDMVFIYTRFADLYNAPPDRDKERFPGYEISRMCLDFNRQYYSHIAEQLNLSPHRAAEYNEILRETDRLHRIWGAIHDVNCLYYYVPVRRAYLKALRELLGVDPYYSGNLPPHVPFWLFQEIP
jgi:hypothetical protein